MFSCSRCNGDYKRDQWPVLGYVDPSASEERERPERYFDYDMLTMEVEYAGSALMIVRQLLDGG